MEAGYLHGESRVTKMTMDSWWCRVGCVLSRHCWGCWGDHCRDLRISSAPLKKREEKKENTSVAQPERKKEKRILHSAKNRDDFPDDDSSSCVLSVFACFVRPSSFYCHG